MFREGPVSAALDSRAHSILFQSLPEHVCMYNLSFVSMGIYIILYTFIIP